MSDIFFLGFDSGAVSMKFVILDDKDNLVYSEAKKNHGDIIKTLHAGLKSLNSSFPESEKIKSSGVTGSGRQLIGSIIKANVVKNEISAHSTATLFYHPDAATIIEIGGQDSKIILIEEGVSVDLEMSGVCGSGTGSFLEQQAARLNIELSNFGRFVKECEQKKDNPCSFGGGCGIFIESAMIRQQQKGTPLSRIVAGLCDSVVTNYLTDTARGKKIKEPVYFQGGVAANEGILRSFEKKLKMKIIVPENYLFMGSIGAAILAKEKFNIDSTAPYNLKVTQIQVIG
ncbi:2-hydroxyglutaryl-CoA dehydratase [bacterium]|nr:2-hydroxyglutaryl-CoA dehydratase [bacterium]